MNRARRTRPPKLVGHGLLLGALVAVGIAVPTGTAMAAEASCADPMVLVFDSAKDSHAEVRLASSAAGVVVDWGGAGRANPVGTGGSASDQVQTYPASPGSVGYDFTSAGLHTVKICGSVSHYGLVDPQPDEVQSGTEALISVTSFGSLGVSSFAHAFRGSSNLVSVPASLPATARDLTGMFMEAYKFTGDLSGWDVSRVTSLRETFSSAVEFNSDLSGWDTSQVTSLRGTFALAKSFDQDLSGWNTSQVTSLQGTFSGAVSFNSDIGTWDTSKVTTMRETFAGSGEDSPRFHQDLSGWNTSQVTDMYRMFAGTRFNADIGDWDTSQVTNLSGMFLWAAEFNQDLGTWDTSKVVDFSEMFSYAKAFNQDLGDWNTANGTDFSFMFSGAAKFDDDIGSWNTSRATNLRGMFLSEDSDSSFNADIGDWDTSKVTDLSGMFAGATKFNADLSGWNTSQVKTMASTFAGASNFNRNLCGWDTRKVTSMAGTFNGATSFDQNLGCWKVRNVRSMNSMLDHSGVRVAHYDATLKAWARQSVKRKVALGAAGVFHSSAATAARAKLINRRAWKIRDAGNQGTPRLSDATPRVDQLLTANPGVWRPKADSYRYQWYRKSPSGKLRAIAGATDNTYRVKVRDLKYRLRVKVIGSVDGKKSTRKSGWSAKVQPAVFSQSPLPVLSPTVQVGTSVAAQRGTWVPEPTTWKYRWYRVSDSGVTRISGADKVSYTPSEADRGHRLLVKVIGLRSGYYPTTRSSKLTDPVQ